MRHVRSIGAAVALVGFAMPGVATVTATLQLYAHHELHHHHHHHHGAHHRSHVDPSAGWHGHSHAPETPDHDHSARVAGTHPLHRPNAKVTPLQPHAALPGPHAGFLAGLIEQRRAPPDPGGADPPRLELLSVLRI